MNQLDSYAFNTVLAAWSFVQDRSLSDRRRTAVMEALEILIRELRPDYKLTSTKGV